MEKKKIHIDTDIGADVDDLCAIAYLLKRPDVTVTGITTCLEVRGRRTCYVKRVLELCGASDIPVGAGEDGTLDSKELYDSAFSAEKMMFGPGIEGLSASQRTAVDIIENSLKQGSAIVAIGPLTNIARVVRKKGHKIFNSDNLFFMGGSLWTPEKGYPAWNRENDWNLNMDLTAAHEVLNCCGLTMVEIAPTLKTFLTERDCARLDNTDGMNSMVAGQGRFWRNHAPFIREETAKCGKLPRDLCNFHYDPLTCAIAAGFPDYQAKEEFIEFCPMPEDHTYQIIRKNGGNRIRSVYDADGESFNRAFMETMLKTLI